jgi:ATP-binding protein involved in chromosome partitioning
MEEKAWVELLELNVETSWNCEFNCEDCYRFFNCPSPAKWELYRGERMTAIRRNMQKIGYKVVVSSGKGGVGKSTVTACLAVTLAAFRLRVGVVDCDFAGPSIPKILGVPLQRLKLGRDGIIPAEGPLGLKVVSMAFLLGRE